MADVIQMPSRRKAAHIVLVAIRRVVVLIEAQIKRLLIDSASVG